MSPLELLTDHTYRSVLVTVSIIGAVAGSLGCFAYLRRQSLIADVVSHSALSGALAAFLVVSYLGGSAGRHLGILMVGALVTGALAAWTANLIARSTKLRIDAAMALTLTFFFGAGMLLLRIITDGYYPGKGGVQDYLFGNASAVTRADLVHVSVVGVLTLALVALLWKVFAARTFDPLHAGSLGFAGRLADGLLLLTIAVGVVIGVKVVGLILMVAVAVTPPAIARQWTRHLHTMFILSGVVGATGAGIGTYLSIRFDDLPTGPAIVLTLFAGLIVSLVVAPQRSIVVRWLRAARVRRAMWARATAGAQTGAAPAAEERTAL